MNDSRKPEALFLGTGTSTGIPLIGCSCAVCTSSDPRNQRLRSSLYFSIDGFGLLVDCSPDFRQQALRYRLPRVDAILITHGHADHVFGLDEIRRFNTLQKTRIPVFASSATLPTLGKIYDYLSVKPLRGTYLAEIDFVELPEQGAAIGPFEVLPFEVEHGRDRTWGFRLGYQGRRFSYAPDCFRFPEASLPLVQRSDVMVLDALRHHPHVTHMTVRENLATLARIGAKRSYLTHLGHDLDHATLLDELPPGVEPAYDGLRLSW